MRGTFDPRPETHHPVDSKELLPVGSIDTADRWRERRKFILGKVKVYDRLAPLLEGAKANTISLALFKPAQLLDFTVEDDDLDWPEDKLAQMRSRAQQSELFTEDEEWRKTFELIPKLPFRFRYRFADIDGRTSTLSICTRITEGDALDCLAPRKYGSQASGHPMDRLNFLIVLVP